jgi:rhamnosyl/mannosyltransferase
MRVLHFSKRIFQDAKGGIEQVIGQLARGSSKFGVTTEVLALTPHGPARTEEIDGYRTHRARQDFEFASTGFSLSAVSQFAALARAADVVHYHYPWPFMDLVHFATRMDKPSVVTYHSDILRQRKLLHLYRPLQRLFLGSVDRIVATSANYLATSDVLGRLSEKVSIIPIGLDRATYPPPRPERLDHWRSRLAEKFFLFVGVFRYYKGLHILLDAAVGLDYPIMIVGAGPTEAELREQAAQLGLCNVHFLGELPDEDKIALLTLCYAVVFPSHLRSEAFGISLLEGAMFGKPMISSELGTGTSFVNADGETGHVVPPSDPVALREAMRVLWENPELAARMGQRALERYLEHFTGEQMVRAYIELYSELVDRRRQTAAGR